MKKDTLRKIITLLYCGLFIATIAVCSLCGIDANNQDNNKNIAKATGEDFEVYFLTQDGKSQIALNELSSYILENEGVNYFPVDMYLSALSAESYEVATFSGYMHFNKDIFSYEQELREGSQIKVGFTNKNAWNLTVKQPIDIPKSCAGLSYIANVSETNMVNIPVKKDFKMATIYLEVNNIYPTIPSTITWDFMDDGDGFSTFTKALEGTNYYYYDMNNVKFTPLQIGEPTAEPSADLETLSLKGQQATPIEYISGFNPETITYNTLQIPYAQSVGGLKLDFTKKSQSATATVTFNAGSSALYDESTKLITGLVDGDVININVVDNEAEPAINKTYSITTAVIPASSNADLSNLTAKAGATNLTFNQPFDKETLGYTLDIPYKTTEVTLSATLGDTLSTMTIDGEAVTSKTFKNLPVGNTVKNIVVTAEDKSTKTYTVTIIRAEASKDTSLGSITVNGNAVDLIDGANSYSYQLAESIGNFVFAISGKYPDMQKIEYKFGSMADYKTMTKGSNSGTPQDIAKNESVPVSIRVTAEDNVSYTLYNLTISRAPSTNTELSSVTIKEGDNTKTLTPQNKVYSYTLGNTGATHITVTAIGKLNENSTIKILQGDGTTEQEVVNGIINVDGIMPGTYTYTIEVTAQSGNKEKYTLNIIKLSNENKLLMPTVQHTNNADTEIVGMAYNATTFTYSIVIDYVLNDIVVNNIRITFMASEKSTITSTGWADLKKGNPDSGRPTAFADISFNNDPGVHNKTYQITVTAEDGTVQNYDIKINRKAADTDNSLSALTVNNVPVEGFQPNILTYDKVIVLPGNTTSVNVSGTANSPFSTVTYNNSTIGQIPLDRGVKKAINIAVTAQSGAVRTYTVYVIAANEDNSISNITLQKTDGTTISGLSFDPASSGPYNITVPFPIDAVKIIIDTPTESMSKVSINGTVSDNMTVTLGVKVNTYKIYATSEAGVKGTEYTVNITRNPARTEKRLDTLKVSSIGVPDYISGFSSTTLQYAIRVNHDVASLKVEATVPLDDGSKITSGLTDNFVLTSGTATINIIVQAEDGSTQTYTINVTRANDITDIDNIQTDVQEITFNPATVTYALSPVPFSKKNINFYVTLKDVYAKLFVKVNTDAVREETNPNNFVIPLKAGANTIEIYAKSEYGTKGTTYKFTVTQSSASNDTKLSSLEVLKGSTNLLTGDNAFEPTKKVYSVRVDDSVTSITINAVASETNAKVSIAPTTRTLNSGHNKFYITVTAESGVQDTYEVDVIRANDNNTITEIKVDGKPVPLDSTKPIVIDNVPFTTKNIVITATLEDSTATLYGDGTKTLVDGTQIFEVYAISQYGLLTGVTKANVPVYTIQITRTPASTDNKLENLSVKDNSDNVLPFDSGIQFAPDRFTYTITLDKDSTLTEVNIIATGIENNKKVSGKTGIQNLTVKLDGTISDQFVITVTSESGATQNYTVNIIKGTSLSSDKTIKEVTLTDSSGNNYLNFNSAIAKQTDVNLPYKVAGLTLNVIPNDPNAQISGNHGYIAVNAGGSTPVAFKIIAQDGSESITYNFTITRATARTDKYLNTLTVKDTDGIDYLAGKFNSGTLTYDLRVDDIVSSVLISATVPANNGSKIISTIQPSYSLTSGAVTQINIIVQAEDESIATYVINIKRANNDNSIESIKLDDKIVPISDFTKVGNNYEYILTDCVYSKTTLNITVNLENTNSKATISGDGIKQLNVGDNALNIAVTAQDGTVGNTYVIRVERLPASSDNTLKSLKITDNNGNVLLDKNSLINETYTLKVSRSVTSVNIEAVKNHIGAMLAGDIGDNNLITGQNNLLKIYVTAENGAKKTYIINIEVKDDDNTITDITVDNYTLNPAFDGVTTIYDIGNVPFSVQKIKINATIASGYATLTGVGEVTLTDGANSFIVYATSESGKKGTEYTIKVSRTSARTDKYLETLIVKDNNGGIDDLLEGKFNKDIKVYDIRVNNSIESVKINATVPENNGSTITSNIDLPFAINSGEIKTINITVKAEDGSTETYTLNIQRANNNATIESITINGNNYLASAFTKIDDKTYTIKLPKVPHSVENADISVITADPNATYTGGGIKKLVDGNNPFDIVVTAQDGITKITYKITEFIRDEASIDNNLKSLKITDNNGKELLNAVSPSIADNYKFTVNRSVTSVNIEAVKNHIGATLAGDVGEIDLIAGQNNLLKIYVTAENGTKKTYTINIEVKDADNKINSITSNLPTLNFDSNIYSYNLDDVSYSTKKIIFGVELNNQYAKLYINGTEYINLTSIELDLAVDSNVFEIHAVSECGTVGKKYTVNINRTPADTNNYLSSLTVTDINGNVLEFNESQFSRDVQKYTVILDKNSTIKEVIISAVAENGTTPTGTGTQQLTEVAGIISNTFTVSVIAESGDIRYYEIAVIKENNSNLSSDNEIKDISLIGKGQEYLKSVFNPSVAKQSPIIVPFAAESVYLNITAHEKAKITGNGLYNINPGETVKITFQITAENGISGLLYEVEVTRQTALKDNVLTNLYYEVDGERIQLDFSSELHNLNIKNTITKIVIGGQAPENAAVTGFGTFDLTDNKTTKVVTVTAENGDVKSYVFNIVKQSDDATIKSIKIDGIEQFGNFVNNVYEFTVPYAKTNITVLATGSNPNANIAGNGSHTLAVGYNEITIYAISEAGTKGEDYIIKIIRETADSNNNLGSLIVRDTATGELLLLLPEFVATTQKYRIDLTDLSDVREILIEAAAQSQLAKKVEGTGTFILKTETGQTSEIFTVTVTAENGSIKKYDITVTRQVKPDDDVTVDDITLIGSDGVNYLGKSETAINKFELNKINYEITVPFKTQNVTLTVINANGATVSGNGNYVLSDSEDTIVRFYLDSQSGRYKSETYIIKVIKEKPSSDNTLSSLTIDGKLINGFDPEITNYEITVSLEDTNSIKIGAVATHIEAKVIGDLGTVNLQAGKNTVNINVTAENGASKTYTVTINRLSKDNRLTDLGVTDYNLSSPFDQTVKTYTLTVPYTTEMVNVVATANPRAKITGIGHTPLQVGKNFIDVYATSEQGAKGIIYQLVITRKAVSTDNTLKSLSVMSGSGQSLIFNPSFNPVTTDYVINLPKGSSVNSLEIFAEANCPLAKGVGGTGYKVLKTTVDGVYNNVFEIIVMAQDNSTKTYTISVYRDVELANDITVGEVNLTGSDGIKYLGNNNAATKFVPNIHIYKVSVPYYVESVTLEMGSLSATVYGTGTKVFGSGDTVEFDAFLVSQSGEVTSEHYYITVERTLALDSNTLKYIRINGVDIEGFNPETMQYEINIPYMTTNRVIISAAPYDASAVILSGTGSFSVIEGRNVFNILVKAESGDTRSYNIVITYLNNNAFLESLSLQGSLSNIFSDDDAIPYSFAFNPETNEYTVMVDKNVKTINIKGAAQDQQRAAIIGLGKYNINEDKTKVVVNVIAADNTTTNTYVLNVIKTAIPSSNSKLKDLRIGGYGLVFNPDILVYTLKVKKGTENLDMNAITQDPNAKVTIIGNNDIEEGKNAVLIMVEAENGSTSVYQLIVTREIAPDYFMTVLLIIVFLLWIVTIVIKLISVSNKNKREEEEQQ